MFLAYHYADFKESNSGQIAFRNEVLSHIKNIDKIFEVTYKGASEITAAEVRNEVEKACSDNNYYRYIWSDMLIQIGSKQNDAEVTLCVQYIITKEQQSFVDTKLAQIISQQVNNDMSDLEKINTIVSYIHKNSSFTLENEKNNPYSLVFEGRSACLGYAMFLDLALNNVGVESKIISGTYDNVPHAWNQVNVDGDMFYIDSSTGGELQLLSKGQLIEKGYVITQ
jgi:transglutaminase/protease-like cytokinesis protein 3